MAISNEVISSVMDLHLWIKHIFLLTTMIVNALKPLPRIPRLKASLSGTNIPLQSSIAVKAKDFQLDDFIYLTKVDGKPFNVFRSYKAEKKGQTWKIKLNDLSSREYVKQRLSEYHKTGSKIRLNSNHESFDFSKVYNKLNEQQIERDVEVKLILLAVLCREHVLLLGPPGTGKSELGRRLASVVNSTGAKTDFFERLLTKYTNPEELFGPLSLSSLEQDKYVRNTQGYLPTASIAFLDEIFKANSAILNSLLTILNERKFDNGNERLDVPLMAVVGASNELPDSEELDALYDRFLFRRQVSPISDDGILDLMKLINTNKTSTIADTSKDSDSIISESVINDIHRLAAQVHVPEYICKLIMNLKIKLKEQNIYISDRRLLKAMKVLRILAVTQDRNEVTLMDCNILSYIFSSIPSDEIKIKMFIHDTVLDTAVGPIKNCIEILKDIEQLFEKMMRHNDINVVYEKWPEYRVSLHQCRERMLSSIYELEYAFYEMSNNNNNGVSLASFDSNTLNPPQNSIKPSSKTIDIRIKNPMYQQVMEQYEPLIKNIHETLQNIQILNWRIAYYCDRLDGDINLLFPPGDPYLDTITP